MKDRVPLYPNRVKLTPVQGKDGVYEMVRDDSPTQIGTPLNKSTLMNEAVEKAYGLGEDNTLSDALLSLIPANNLKGTSQEIPSGADLNDYIVPGAYVSVGTSITETLVNAPPFNSGGFRLIVSFNSNDVSTIQVATYNASASYIFYRVRTGSTTWRAWRYLETNQSSLFKTAGGTGTAITVSPVWFALDDGMSLTFIAKADNGGAATTLNVFGLGAKPLYKAGTTSAPTIKANEAYTVWYSSSGDCFFAKASSGVTAAELAYGTTYTVFSGNYSSLPVIPIQSSYKKIYTLNFPESVRGAVRVELAFDNVSTATVSFKIGNTTGSASGTNTASSNITIPDNGVVEISAYAGSGSSSTVRLKSIAVKIASGICNGTPATS
jgi:hypothetical protein